MLMIFCYSFPSSANNPDGGQPQFPNSAERAIQSARRVTDFVANPAKASVYSCEVSSARRQAHNEKSKDHVKSLDEYGNRN